ncbi:hypothetical protein [Rhodococcus spongiicola]|uniref:Holin n=1 Tax=Rhodococcus spongiicola TaxID=2487352 RepID=A0A438B6D3_9NOCA|nr:hypothetical protein [Rhodococcus spongiicola]RVW06518.1 hypothetical protein EF834_03670 [Rhodococcus spongiicola]
MDTDSVAGILRAKLADQPLVRRYANTATAAVMAIVAVLWTVLSVGVDVPSGVTTAVLVLISVATVVGVKFTPNGVTARQIDEIEKFAERRG